MVDHDGKTLTTHHVSDTLFTDFQTCINVGCLILALRGQCAVREDKGNFRRKRCFQYIYIQSVRNA